MEISPSRETKRDAKGGSVPNSLSTLRAGDLLADSLGFLKNDIMAAADRCLTWVTSMGKKSIKDATEDRRETDLFLLLLLVLFLLIPSLSSSLPLGLLFLLEA